MHEKVQLDEGFLEVHCKATRRLLERKSCNFAWIIVIIIIIIIIITLNLELSIDFF
jgi:t-SNARE complex subunit (syntaxin)